MDFIALIKTHGYHAVTSLNFTAAIILTFLSAYIFKLLVIDGAFNDKTTSIKQIMAGVMIESFGWALHRGFYGIVRYTDMRKNVSPDMIDVYLTTIPIFIILIILLGNILIVSPILSPFFDADGTHHKRSIVMTSIITLGIFWFLYWTL